MLPQDMGCGSGITCWRRWRQWQESGVWTQVHQVLLERLYGPDRLKFLA
jgi:transposase